MEAWVHSLLGESNSIVVFIVFGLSLYSLGKGADFLVDNAVLLSLRMGIPEIVLGATLISLGTTLPEASVSVLAAIKGDAQLALGNAIGSIIADTGLIMGIAAMLGAIPLQKSLINRQGRMQMLAVLLLVVATIPWQYVRGSANMGSLPVGQVTQRMGIVFVILLILYLYTSFTWAKHSLASQPEETSADSTETPSQHASPLLIVFVCIGIAVVVISSNVLIPSVEILAMRIGVPQGIIAGTLVAFGTSLPELITGITAVKKGHGELAIGNVIGADILNVLFVVGVSAAVTPQGIPVPTYFYWLQIPAMFITVLLFRIITVQSMKHNRPLRFGGGLLLLVCYTLYLILNFISAIHLT